jgi:hypothetical protein
MNVIALHVPHIVREPDAEGWLIIWRSFGWLFGSRSEALSELEKLMDEVR